MCGFSCPLHFADIHFCSTAYPQLSRPGAKQLRRRQILAGCLLFKLADKRRFLPGGLFLCLRQGTGFRRDLRNQRQIILLTNPATVSGLSDLLLNTL
ncbi:Uncharacterised protein [Shigella sonnei]|nr:Uncharacterised protein [Shigella sonnei]